MTEVRLITFRSAILARSVKISSCSPSVKKALSGSRLRFSKGRTAMLLSEITAVDGEEEADAAAGDAIRPPLLERTTWKSNKARAIAANAATIVTSLRPVLRAIDWLGTTSSVRLMP